MVKRSEDEPSLGENTPKSNEVGIQVSGELTFSDKVIQKIVGIAIEKVDGLLSVKSGFFSSIAEKVVNTDNVTSGIETEVGKKQVAVDMEVICEYGKDATKIYNEIKRVVRTEVEKMTHLEIVEINVQVSDIQTKKEFEENLRTLQDQATNAANKVGDYVSEKSGQVVDKTNKNTDYVGKKTEPKAE